MTRTNAKSHGIGMGEGGWGVVKQQEAYSKLQPTSIKYSRNTITVLAGMVTIMRLPICERTIIISLTYITATHVAM